MPPSPRKETGFIYLFEIMINKFYKGHFAKLEKYIYVGFDPFSDKIVDNS